MLRTDRFGALQALHLGLARFGVEVFAELVQLAAQVVAGDRFADGDAQRGELPGEVLGVRLGLRRPVAVLFQ